MTVPVPGSLTFAYDVDGVTTVFPYPVRFMEPEELAAIHEKADGEKIALSYNVDYTVTGAGDANGGYITTLFVAAEGKIILTRDTAAKQLVDLRDGARNPAEAVEQQLDRMTMVDQDHGGRLSIIESQTGAIDEAVRRAELARDDAEAAEGAAEAAQHAAEVAQSAAEAAAAGVNLPPVTPNTMLVDNADGTARETKTFEEVKEIWDPSADLLHGEGLKLTYHKARGAWHVSSFGSSLTEVGGGSDSADTAALKAAIASQEIIDITGTNLRINDVIDIDYSGACITSTLSNRVGAIASSSIFVTDDAMPKLFNVSATNFEVDGFRLEANPANSSTTWFHYERAAGSASDIDSVIERISATYGKKLFHIYGRGLKVRDVAVAMLTECVGDLDWPSSWTPNGQSNDTQKTGMRGYEFSDLRFHGTAGGIRNIGANAKNCRGISMANVLADIGGANGVFSGVAVESRFVNIGSHINAVTAGLLFDIHGGSTKSEFIGFHGGGIKDGTDERLSNNVINIRPTASDPISDLHFIGGSIGPCRRNGLQIAGGGVAKNILLQGVTFDRPGLDGGAYVPISIFDNGGTLTEVSLKMSACHFELPGLAPTQIVGGKNSNVITIMKDTLTTKPATIPWAQTSVVIV